MGIRIGVDVGEKSLGLAAIDYDDDGWPIRILAAVSHIHDGGMDPETAKSPQSRLATAGVARRTRRLIRNRRRRLQALDEMLRKHGFDVPSEEIPQTYEAWDARDRLSREFVTDDEERNRLLVLALRHLARHRGWRNPWSSYARLEQEPTPSAALTAILDKAKERYGEVAIDEAATLGQVVAGVARSRDSIRLTKAAKSAEQDPVILTQVKQEDSLAEAKLILQTQRVPETTIDEICRVLMFQNKPKIPKDRIGACALIPGEVRASLATLEFQEYRVRSTVANLKIGKAKQPLTPEQHDLVCEWLLAWRESDRPKWREVADLLGIPPRELPIPSVDDAHFAMAPVQRTYMTLESVFNAKSEIGSWWRSASQQDQGEFIAGIADLSGDDGELESANVAALMTSLTDKSREALDKLQLETGRAAYSREALRRLNEVMRADHCDAHTARKKAFDLDDNWKPPQPSFSDHIEHPTVARINILIRRFLTTAVEQWGMPERIVVEHVRGAFMGPSALAELKSEIRFNTARREKTRADLRIQGISEPRDADIRRNECVQRQNSQCLYCGTSIGLTTSELDHVVPRAAGGGNRRDNLVAVCKPCNAAKGKLPFAVFADQSQNPEITVEAAKTRVRSWQKLPGVTPRQLSTLKTDVQYRLGLVADDDDFGDRSIESTAYAAREMRARIQSFVLERGGDPNSVWVFGGAVTSEARKAGGIDGMMRLREFTKKSRFDRRHHAIDAAVMTSLRPAIAETLRHRTNLQNENRMTGKYSNWKEYRGQQPGDEVNFEEWKQRVGLLAELLTQHIRDDRVPVMRQLRLSPRIGSVHADTVEPLEHRLINGPFAKEEVRRVVNNRLYESLLEESAGKDLEPDSERGGRLHWAAERIVDLYPSTAAFIPVRGGAVAIGSTVRYARIYAWRIKAGFAYGMVRMYVGELALIGLLAPGVDLFTAPLPVYSQAMRTANPALVARIVSGEARQIGWVSIGDEIEIDPENFLVGEGKIERFLKEVPEKHWLISGFFDPAKFSIAPALLASEGLDETMPEIVRQVVADNRIPTAVNVLLGSPECVIVRRTITGSVRWRSEGLPIAWKPREAAEQAFQS